MQVVASPVDVDTALTLASFPGHVRAWERGYVDLTSNCVNFSVCVLTDCSKSEIVFEETLLRYDSEKLATCLHFSNRNVIRINYYSSIHSFKDTL